MNAKEDKILFVVQEFVVGCHENISPWLLLKYIWLGLLNCRYIKDLKVKYVMPAHFLVDYDHFLR